MRRAALFALALFVLPAAPALAASCQPGFASLLPSVVRKADVAAIDASDTIRLWQFCEGREFHDLGNAAGLIRTIKANPALITPIKQKGWDADDVKFVRVGPGFIDLWLHRN